MILTYRHSLPYCERNIITKHGIMIFGSNQEILKLQTDTIIDYSIYVMKLKKNSLCDEIDDKNVLIK